MSLKMLSSFAHHRPFHSTETRVLGALDASINLQVIEVIYYHEIVIVVVLMLPLNY